MFAFLSPLALLSALAAGGIVVVYLLKLKRRRHEFSSTMLWAKSVEDLTANAPFQKLRQNPLMWLQILALLLLAAALARPALRVARSASAARILLIDNSASMNARDAEGRATRLDAAKAAAGTIVDNLRADEEAMVVAMGGAARVVLAFTSDRTALKSAIASIEPTDAEARAIDAMRIVRGVKKVAGQATTTILSDGGLGYLEDLLGEREKDPVEFVAVGTSGENAGFVSFDVRESFDKRGEAQAFGLVKNFGAEPREALVRCLVDGEVVAAREATLGPGEAVGFEFPGLSGSPLRVRLELTGDDPLASDDAVEGIVELDRSVRVLLVGGGNRFVERALALVPGAEVFRVEPKAFDPATPADVVVFDQFSPPALPPGRHLFLDALPPADGFVRRDEPLTDTYAADWNRLHPAMRYLSFEELAVGRAIDYDAPDWTIPLVDGPDAPLILAGERAGSKILVVAFDVYSSDWPLQPTFPIFFANALDWLRARGADDSRVAYRAGETATLGPRSDAEGDFVVRGPGGAEWRRAADENGTAYFNETFRAGVYEVSRGGAPVSVFAVNLLSEIESDIAPRSELISGEQRVAAATVRRENREMWHWFALAALAFMAVEWHLYCRRSWL